MPTELGGVLTALATPFTPDEQLDLPRLRYLVDRAVDAGVGGVVACGSTGEFAALSADERIVVVDTVIDQAAGRVPVIAQTGATTTAEAIRLSLRAQEAGADVLMLVTPYYEPLSLAETTDYIRRVAEMVALPVMLYNIPAATGVNLDPETVGTLARGLGNVRYIKDSSANMEQALQLIHHYGDDIDTFIGWDSLTFAALSEGAAGVMAGAANVLPHELVRVHRAILAGDHDAARAEWNRIYPIIDGLLSVPFVPAIKAAMRALGEPIGSPRRPTHDLNSAQVEHIEALIAQVRLADASA